MTGTGKTLTAARLIGVYPRLETFLSRWVASPFARGGMEMSLSVKLDAVREKIYHASELAIASPVS